MVILTKKLFRDLKNLKEQFFLISLVICSGIGVLIASLSTYVSLYESQKKFYNDYHFADIFVDLKRASVEEEKKIAAISNINRFETRIVMDGSLYRSNQSQPMIGRFISLSDNPNNALNQLHLLKGNWPEEKKNEVLVNESFAIAQKLQPGDKISARLNGKFLTLTITGIVLSPEFVYAIRSEDLLPDDQNFGIFWMNRSTLAAIAGMQEAFNNIVIQLAPHTHEFEKAAVIRQIKNLFQSAGARKVLSRKEQVSNQFIENEIQQLKIFATIIPAIFLIVTAFLINMVMKRLVTIQRQQIATLKSLGFSSKEIGLYYFKLVFFIVTVGMILGIIVGYFSGLYMKHLYAGFFHFPVFTYFIPWWAPVIGGGISFMAAGIGTLGCVKEILLLPAAEAMRPAMPSSSKKTFLEKFSLFKKLPTYLKFCIRSLLRTPTRTFFTILAIAAAIAIIILSLFWENALDTILETQFKTSQRQHLILTFTKPVDKSAQQEILKLPGVLKVEGYRILPIRISYQNKSYQSGLMGLPENATLRLLLKNKQETFKIPQGGILISMNLAKYLHAKPSDLVHIESLEGKQSEKLVRVIGIVQDYIGMFSYANEAFIQSFMNEPKRSNIAALLVDKNNLPQFFSKIKSMPFIATSKIKNALIEVFQKTFEIHVLVFTRVLAGYAIFIAVGVIYNILRITLSEQTLELATLRVLGFAHREVFLLFTTQLGILLLLAIPIGSLLGYLLSVWVVNLMDTDFFTIPLVIKPTTYLFANLIILITAFIGAVFMNRKIKQLKLTQILKVPD